MTTLTQQQAVAILNAIPSRRMRVVHPITKQPAEMEVITIDLSRQSDLLGQGDILGVARAAKRTGGETAFYASISSLLGDDDGTLVLQRMGGLGFDHETHIELSTQRLKEIAGRVQQQDGIRQVT